MRFLVLPQHELAKFCLKPVSETQYISSSCTLCCMLSKLYASFTIKCIKNVLWPTDQKFIYLSKWFHAVLYIALENHVPLPRFPETFSMWYRIVFGTKLHRFHYCCNLWWVQPLYCINTPDYDADMPFKHLIRVNIEYLKQDVLHPQLALCDFYNCCIVHCNEFCILCVTILTQLAESTKIPNFMAS